MTPFIPSLCKLPPQHGHHSRPVRRASTYRRNQLRGWAYRIRTSMCREKIHLFEHSAMFGFAWTDADRPVVPGELSSASGWIACYPQVPHRAAAGAAFQVRHIEVRILSRRLIGLKPQQDSEFLDIGICGNKIEPRASSYDPGMIKDAPGTAGTWYCAPQTRSRRTVGA
jgi:hypothetical protein